MASTVTVLLREGLLHPYQPLNALDGSWTTADGNESASSSVGNSLLTDIYANDSSSAESHGVDGFDWPSISELEHSDFLPEELPSMALSIFAVLYVVIIVVGLGGNATTIVVVLLNREMRTVTNVFLVSLAVSDALIAGVNMPVQLKFHTENEWTLGAVACKVTMYLQGVVIVVSILTLTALAIDRYYAICHPLRARHVHTTTRAAVIVVIIWFASLLLVAPQLFIQRLEPMLALQLDREPPLRLAQVCVEYFAEHAYAIAYTTFHYVTLYMFPAMTMFVAYGTIASRLWHRQQIGETPRDSIKDSTRRLKEKKRIVCMLVLIVALFTISWFPFFTIQLYLLVDSEGHRDSTIRMTVAVLQLVGYSNCCANPIVYCFLNESFQKHLLRTLRCRFAVRLVAVVKDGRASTSPSGAVLNAIGPAATGAIGSYGSACDNGLSEQGVNPASDGGIGSRECNDERRRSSFTSTTLPSCRSASSPLSEHGVNTVV